MSTSGPELTNQRSFIALARTCPPLKFLALLLGTLAVLSFIVWDQIPATDRPQYFDFADRREFFGVPNAFDVLSNLAFVAAGLYGIVVIVRLRSQLSKSHFISLSCLAVAGLLTAVGSSYFHVIPTVERLFWDRLPMTVGFSAIVALLVTDRLDRKAGLLTAALLIPIGMMTVIGWNQGLLDLKPYYLLQFGGLLLVVPIVFLRERGQDGVIAGKYYYQGLGLYALAKVLETYDVPIYEALGAVSGHTLKHLAAAIAIWRIFSFANDSNHCASSQPGGAV